MAQVELTESRLGQALEERQMLMSEIMWVWRTKLKANNKLENCKNFK